MGQCVFLSGTYIIEYGYTNKERAESADLYARSHLPRKALATQIPNLDRSKIYGQSTRGTFNGY